MTLYRSSGRRGRRARRLPAISVLLAMVSGASLTGCASNTQTGILVGGAGGATAGAAVEPASGHAGSGAVIGGSLGLIGGGLVGNSTDQVDRRHEQQ